MSNIIDKIQVSGVTYTLSAETGGGGTVSSAITSGDTNAVAGGAVYDKFDEVEQVTARALIDLDTRIIDLSGSTSGGGISSGEVQTMIDESISGKADTSSLAAVATSGDYNDLDNKPTIPSKTSDLTNDSNFATSGYVDSSVSGKQDTLISGSNIKTINNESVLGSGNITIQGGNDTVELTQAEYDALVSAGTVASDTYYIITDAIGVGVTTAVTSGSTDSDIPTAKAVYNAIPTVTNAITSGSTDAITSGAVYDALGDVETLLSQI